MSQYFDNDNNIKHNKKIIEFYFNDKKYNLYSDNGVFSKDKFDYGTRLLLDSIDISKFNGGSHTIKIELYYDNTVLTTTNTTFNFDKNLHVQYMTHVQDEGWQDWKKDGEMAGTTGKSKRMEAIRIRLKNANDYTVRYRVHVQDYGWMDWHSDGEIAGTVGESKRIEAIQIEVIKKPKVEVSYTYNEDKNTVTAVIKSDKELKSVNDTEWNLSSDKLTYTKEFDKYLKENNVQGHLRSNSIIM